MLPPTLNGNPYVIDILAQPQALRDTLDGLRRQSLDPIRERIAAGMIRRIILTGMGSSHHALYPLLLVLRGGSLDVDLIETSELIYYQNALLQHGTLIVAVSQSGRSAEIVRLLEIVQGRLPVLGVTNTASSALADQADQVIMTTAGAEHSVSCKTYVAAMAALAWIGAVLTEHDSDQTLDALTPAAEGIALYVQDWQAHVQYLIDQLVGVQYVTLVGRGASMAAVGTGALIIKESAHFPADGLGSAAFRHGPLEMVSAQQFVMVYGGSEPTRALNVRLFEEIQTIGGRALLISEDSAIDATRLPTAPEIARPILDILPAQMLSLALAVLNQHDPGRFERASKVTTTE